MHSASSYGSLPRGLDELFLLKNIIGVSFLSVVSSWREVCYALGWEESRGSTSIVDSMRVWWSSSTDVWMAFGDGKKRARG